MTIKLYHFYKITKIDPYYHGFSLLNQVFLAIPTSHKLPDGMYDSSNQTASASWLKKASLEVEDLGCISLLEREFYNV